LTSSAIFLLDLLNAGLALYLSLLTVRSLMTRFKGGKLARSLRWLLAAGLLFAGREVLRVVFAVFMPAPWWALLYDLLETGFLVVFIMGLLRLGRVIPQGGMAL
jgi:hypothetical protein